MSGILQRVRARAVVNTETAAMAVPTVIVVTPQAGAPSNELVLPVQTEAITLCFSLVRTRAAAGACAAIAKEVVVKDDAARGAAAIPSKKSLRFMSALYCGSAAF